MNIGSLLLWLRLSGIFERAQKKVGGGGSGAKRNATFGTWNMRNGRLDAVRTDWFACHYNDKPPNTSPWSLLSDRSLSELLKPVSTRSLGQMRQRSRGDLNSEGWVQFLRTWLLKTTINQQDWHFQRWSKLSYLQDYPSWITWLADPNIISHLRFWSHRSLREQNTDALNYVQ